MIKELEIAKWSNESDKFIQETTKLLISLDKNNIVSKENFKKNEQISIVFAGQYSAGKSSILKSLTGISTIEIGVGITTQIAHSYEWNNIEVIDTPGIHTKLRPDHDEISYHAIANADLLVYVVTKELFDNFIGENFRKILIDKHKAGEMILVVNKMADIGNTKDNQEIKLKDLETVTSPYLPSQLRTTFIDAESYLESLEETDQEIVKELLKRSNFENFENVLNSFIQEKGISSKLTTNLYKLDETIDHVIEQYQASTGDDDLDALKEQFYRERKLLIDNKYRAKNAILSKINDLIGKIREKGNEIANFLSDCQSEDEANNMLEKATIELEAFSSDCEKNIYDEIKDITDKYLIDLENINNTDFAKKLNFRLEEKVKSNPIISNIKKLASPENFKLIGSQIVSNSVNDTAKIGLKQFGGSNVHKMVLKVGHFFGYKFKPYEALKYTDKISKFGTFSQTFGIVLSVGMQIKDDIDADRLQNEMSNNRSKIRGVFNMMAEETEKHFKKSTEKFLELFQNDLEKIDKKISVIETSIQDKTDNYKKLQNAKTECLKLIKNIQITFAKS